MHNFWFFPVFIHSHNMYDTFFLARIKFSDLEFYYARPTCSVPVHTINITTEGTLVYQIHRYMEVSPPSSM